MPILQEINDPYANSNASALSGLTNGGGIEAQARAQALAAQIRAADVAQQKAAQEMRLAEEKARQENTKFGWETTAHKQNEAAQDAAGRYFGYATPAPVGVDGAQPSRQDMERYYREQNYRDQAARAAIRAGKGTEDIAKGMNDYETNFRTAHPAGGAQPMSMPADIAGNPVAAKKFAEEKAKQMADQQQADEQSKIAAGKYLPEMLRARQHYSDASGYIGQIEGNEWTQGVQNIAGKLPGAGGLAQGVAKRAALEKEMAAFQGPQIAANNKGLGPMTNYEQQLARLPFAKVNDVNAQVGLSAFDGQLAHTLKTMGYAVPPAHISMLLDGIKNQDPSVMQEFAQAHGPKALQVIMGALQ
jgi:hypothetical protein